MGNPVCCFVGESDGTPYALFADGRRLDFMPRLLPSPERRFRRGRTPQLFVEGLKQITLSEGDKVLVQLECWPDRLVTVQAGGLTQVDLAHYWWMAYHRLDVFHNPESMESHNQLTVNALTHEEALKNLATKGYVPVAPDALTRIQQIASAVTSRIPRR